MLEKDRKALYEKLMAYSMDDPETGCRVWMRNRKKTQYGLAYGKTQASPRKTQSPGKYWSTHRLMWRVVKGPIPEGKFVLHKCNNPPCINIEHLYIGDHNQNMQDKVKANRQSFSRGELHPLAKITEEDVRVIRKLYAMGIVPRVIAEKYNLTKDGVYQAATRRTWSHVT